MRQSARGATSLGSSMLMKFVVAVVDLEFNNVVEQDHRFIKRLVNPGMGFGSFDAPHGVSQGVIILNFELI